MKRSLASGFKLFLLPWSVIVLPGCESTSVAAVEVSSVVVSPSEIILLVTATRQLTASARGASGNALSGRTITWSSANPSIATVDQSGVVRGVAAGIATIRATAEGVTGQATVTVNPRPSIVLSQSQVRFESDFGGGPTEFVAVEITNGSEGTLSELRSSTSYPSGGPQGWLEASLSSGTAPATLSLRAIPTVVPAGAHAADVEIRSSVAGNSPQTIRVVLQVGEAPPSIAVSTEVVSFASDAGQANPPTQTVNVTNGGGGVISGLSGVLAYEAGSGSGWLQWSLNPTTAPADLTITVDPEGLVPGVYDAVITMSAASAPGSTAEVRVRYRFGTPPPEIELPETVEAELLERTLLAVLPAVVVGNRGTGTLGDLAIVLDYAPGEPTGWLEAILDSNTGPTNMQLQIRTGVLLPGEYTATVTVSSPDAINSPQVLEVILTVLPRPSLQLSTITATPSAIVADGISMSTVEVQINDLRGDPMPTGGNVVTLNATVGFLGPVTDSGGGAYSAVLRSTTLAQQSAITGTLDGQALVDDEVVDFVPGPPDGATTTIDAAPASIEADGVTTATVTVQAIDVNGNLLTVGGDAVTLMTDFGTLGPVTDVGDGTYTATLTSSTVAGTATVTGTIGNVPPPTPATPAATIADDASVDFVAGPPAQLAITAQPSGSVQNGVEFAQQPIVQVQDAFGNSVTQAGVDVTAAIATGGGVLGGATAVATDASGAAVFLDLSITGTIGDRTLEFASGALTAVASNTISVTAGPATQLVMVAQPSASAQNGVAFAQQPSVRLQDVSGNDVSQAGVNVAAAIASGGGALGGTTPVATDGAGIAAFAALSITGTIGDRTLQFSSGGLASATSNTISITAGPATQLVIVAQPSASAQSGVAFAQQPVVRLRDSGGNNVSQSGVNVAAAIASGGGALGGTTPVATDGSGVATFAGLSITGTIGDRTLQFTSGALTAVASNTINVTAGPATQLVMVTQPSAAAQNGVAFAQQPSVRLRDASGNDVNQSGVNVAAAIASGGGALGGTTPVATNGSGIATFAGLSITGTIGDRTLQFTSGALTAVTSNTISITAGPATQLVMVTQPSASAQNGVAFAQQPSVRLRDSAGNNVSQSGVNVAAAIASGGGALGGTTPVATNGSGIATFAGLSITGTIGDRTLEFTSGALTVVTSNTISITAGPATQLVMVTQPSASAQNGVAFAQQPSVRLRDSAGNNVSQSGVNVAAAIASGGGALGGTTPVATNGSGIATFAGLSITGTIGDRTLQFSSGGLASATSNTISVTAGPATQLVMATQPSGSAQNGVAFAQQPVVRLRDSGGNNVSQSGVNVAAAIASGGGALGGTTPVATNGSGVATFAGLSITGTIGDRTLQFTSGALTAVTSNTVSITAGPATQLVMVTQPSAAAQNGVAFAQQPSVRLRDASGNDVNQSGVNVAAAIASGGGALGGTTPVATNGSGIATFAGLSITGTIGDRTLQFTSGALTAVTSNTISITAGPATQLVMVTQPSAAAQNGVAFAQQPAVRLRDASGNDVNQSGVNVAAAIASGGGALGGTTPVATNGSGIATFAGLSITGTIGDRTLEFTSGALTAVTSNTISITAGPATQLVMVTQPSGSAQNGVAFAQQPVVRLRDSGGNNVSQSGVNVAAAIASGGGALGGTTPVATDGSGIATFAGLSITGTIGDRTLEFTSGGLASATSNTISITAGPATQLVMATQPSGSAQNGVAFAQQPVVRLRDSGGNNVSQSGVNVAAAIASGGGALGGTTPVATDGSGVATFAGLSITGTIGDRTLQFTSGALTAVTSNTVSITAGPATQLVMVTQPSAAAQNGVAFAQQPSVRLRDASGNDVNQSGVNVAAAIASGGGALGGTTPVATNGSGIATFAGLSITGTIGDRTLQFTSGALTAVTSNTISITAGPATQLVMVTQPSAAAQNGVAFAQQPAVRLRDASGNDVNQSGVNVAAAIASGGGALGGTTPVATNGSGIATFAGLSITGTIGDRTLEFTSGALTAVTSNTISITAGPATQLVMVTQPSGSAQNGVAFAQQPVVRLRDSAGNNVSQSGVNVAAAIASGGGALGGTTPVATDGSGIATFAGLSITGTIGDRTLHFSSGGLASATSNTISVTAGPATQLVMATQPSGSAQNGVAFAQQPVVRLRDSGGNNVSQSGVNVAAAIASGGGALGGTTPVATDGSGVATFAGLSITGTIGDRTLQFTSGALTPVTSNTISITAGPATQLVMVTQPSAAAQNGVAFAQQPSVRLRDASGNDVNQSGVNVAAAIASGGGALGGTTPVATNGSGVATFAGLSITGTIGDRTLQFTSGALTPVTSNTISITAGPATQLVMVTQPSAAAQNGVAFAQQPSVRLRDASGNDVNQSGVNVAAAIASGGGALGGTTPVATNGSGIATFAGLSITGTIGDRTLEFTSGALTAVTSNTISITAGPATQLVMVTQPSASAQNGVAFAQQPVVRLRDSGGNNVSQSGVNVAAAIASGGGALGGTTPVATDGSGIATFAGLSITGTIGDRTLEFTSGGLTSATSNTISVTPGAAAQIQLTGPATVEELQTSTNFTITVQDVSGNTTTVAQETDFSLSSNSGTETFDPVSPATVLNGGSTATFTYSDPTVGTWTVTATWSSGGTDLGNDTHDITVTAAPE